MDNQKIAKPSQSDIYEVQEIVGMKKVGDTWLYRVRWKGYGPQSDTWEPEPNLRTVWKMVEKYKAKTNKTPMMMRNKKRGRPSVNGVTQNVSLDPDFTDDSGSNHKNARDVKSDNNKKRIKNNRTENNNKDTFWKDLEEGRIDVFKEDLYSRVKSRASSRTSSIESSPKLVKSPDKSWSQSSIDSSCDSSDTSEHDSTNIRIKYSKIEGLISAIKDSDHDLAEILIKNGVEINSTYGSDEITPLLYACELNNVKMVQLLLQNGAKKDIQNKNGDTALIIACRFGYCDIIKLLLSYGANFAVINKIDMNALRISKMSEEKNIRDILIKHITRLSISFELHVMNILCNTAQIVNALFPIQCFAVNEGPYFKLMFTFDQHTPHQSPGVGYILFIAYTSILSDEIKCKSTEPDTVEEVLLNGIPQKSLTEDDKFVFSFSPLQKGENELIVHTISSERSKIKLIVCAYEAKLIANCANIKSN